MSIAVLFGNAAPVMQLDGRAVPAEHLEQSVTRVEFADYIDDSDFVDRTLSTSNDRMLAMIARSLPKDLRRYAVAVNEAEQIIAAHSPDAAPAWVACDDQALEAALAKHFGCARGEPTALLTNGGRDALHAQHLSTAAQPAAFNFVALTANSAAESAANTTLPGEITTAGGGLVRAQGTYAHTAGTNTSTVTRTATANGSDALPVTIAKVGLFNAASSGTLGYEKLLNATATLTISGDNLTTTHTLTVG